MLASMTNPLDDAACAFFVKVGIVHPDIWFSPEFSEDEEIALSICSLCQVSEYCRDLAIDTNQEYGIWGGRQFADSDAEDGM